MPSLVLQDLDFTFALIDHFYAYFVFALSISAFFRLQYNSRRSWFLYRRQRGIREFKKLRRLLQRKRHIKFELCVRLSILRFSSMLITLYKIGELHFRLLGTNGFHVKAKGERFIAATSLFCQNLKYENFTSSFGRLRQNIAPKSVPHVQHDYFSSFNQSNH